MIFTPGEYLAYIGTEVPAERYYDTALAQLKQSCPNFTLVDLTEEDMAIVKKALMLQLDYYYSNYNAIKGFVDSFLIGKFSMTESTESISPFSTDALLLLHGVFDCSLWLTRNEDWCL